MATNTEPSMIQGNYSANKFQEKYKVDNLIYPEDLQSSIYGGNKVIFYINIADSSKFAKNPDNFVDLTNMDIPRLRGTLIAGNHSALGIATSIASGVGIGAAIAGGILTGDPVKGVGVGLMAGILGEAVGAAVVLNAPPATTTAASGSRPQKRLKSVIALHIPNSLGIRYNTNWGETDTAEMMMVGDSITGFLEKKGGSGLANLALTKGPGGDLLSSATGVAANPRKEAVFKGIDFRTFSFNYSFFPRNENEARNVQNIIKMFKFHMHPELKDSSNFLYLYPSEFDIVYYKDSEENLNLHRHTSCVLVGLDINYTPNGNFTTFANGMSTQTDITLQFKELALLDKDLISQGL